MRSICKHLLLDGILGNWSNKLRNWGKFWFINGAFILVWEQFGRVEILLIFLLQSCWECKCDLTDMSYKSSNIRYFTGQSGNLIHIPLHLYTCLFIFYIIAHFHPCFHSLPSTHTNYRSLHYHLVVNLCNTIAQ